MASSSTPNLKAYGRKFLCKHQVQERWFCNTRHFPSAHNFNYTVTKAFLCLLHGAPLLQFWWLQWHHRCLVKWLSRCKFGFIWLSKLRKQRKCSSKVHTLLPQSIYPLLWLPKSIYPLLQLPVPRTGCEWPQNSPKGSRGLQRGNL